MNDLLYGSAVDLAKAIRWKHISAVEATRAFLSRIGTVNPTLNAVVQLREEDALADARHADLDKRAGGSGFNCSSYGPNSGREI
jgi:Asp-tRNA(Asn)/Glu-tRNA(Gln) amidotransferase A subunit family amidase